LKNSLLVIPEVVIGNPFIFENKGTWIPAFAGMTAQYTQTYVKKRWKHYTRIVKGLRIIVTARTHEQAIFQMPDVLTKGFRNFYYNSTANGYRRISV